MPVHERALHWLALRRESAGAGSRQAYGGTAAAESAGAAAVGPATPNGRRHSNADWPFPFPTPGRWQGKKKIPANTERRQPWVDVDAVDPNRIAPRFVRSPVPLADFVAHVKTFADDAGVISIDHPALAHERDEIRYVYPHARSLMVMIGEENKASMQSRYLPSANHELYECEERLFQWGHAALRYVRSLGGDGLTTTIGWPQEVSVRWADKIWPLSHKLVAQAAGLGVIGTSRNFLHRRFGAYCLIDTVVTNLEFAPEEYAVAERADRLEPLPRVQPLRRVVPDRRDQGRRRVRLLRLLQPHLSRLDSRLHGSGARPRGGEPRKFEHRWSDAEIAALWQSMAFRVEYRCFNCVATCPGGDPRRVPRRQGGARPTTSARR